MPYVRIDVIKDRYAADQRAMTRNVVYEALLYIGALTDDGFHVISEHDCIGLGYGRTYCDIQRSDGFVAIQIKMNQGRNPGQKKGLFAAIAENIGKACRQRASRCLHQSSGGGQEELVVR